MFDYQHERIEALEAGRRSLESLRAAQRELTSARNWGVFDMLGGGLISGLMKRAKINNSQKLMDQARYDLQVFTNELSDINLNGDLGVNVNDFLGMADLFWDNFFVDWMMQDRIVQSLDNIHKIEVRVQNILNTI